MWSLYNIIRIKAFERKRYRLKACTIWIDDRKRILKIHNDNKDENDRKLHSTVCKNRLHMRYRRDPKSSIAILDIDKFTRAPFANSLANIDLNVRFECSI
jgi:hypothetical protein